MMAAVKTCEDCKQRVNDACITHLKRVKPEHVACVYHSKAKATATRASKQRCGVSRALLLGLLLTLIAPVYAGSTFNGSCYATQDAALAAFRQTFPMSSGASLVDLQSSMLAGSGVSYTTVSTNLNGGTPVSASGSVTFLACDYDTYGWSQVQTSSVVLYSVLMVCFFIGVRMGFLI